MVLHPDKMTTADRLNFDHVGFRMELHRALLRGTGYYDVVVPQPKEEDRHLPVIENLRLEDQVADLPWSNFLNIKDEALVRCIVEEALPADRTRFRAYLSYRPLGLGLIASVSFQTKPISNAT